MMGMSLKRIRIALRARTLPLRSIPAEHPKLAGAARQRNSRVAAGLRGRFAGATRACSAPSTATASNAASPRPASTRTGACGTPVSTTTIALPANAACLARLAERAAAPVKAPKSVLRSGRYASPTRTGVAVVAAALHAKAIASCVSASHTAHL